MGRRIVANLVSNAVKFTPSGTISVRLREAGEDVVLTVADTGFGIPAEELTRIFQRFHQAPGDPRRAPARAPASGLSLVADLAEAHGGSVAVDSAVGTGSTFSVRLPMGTAVAAARPVDIRTGMAAAFRAEAEGWVGATDSEPAAEPEQPLLESGHVLVVEDNADMRAYLTRLLRAEGWRVTAVADAAAALRTSPPPDLLLSDVMLPGTDGLELTRALRRLPATARLPIVLLTARAGPESAADGLAAGADDYVVKPFHPTELLARIRVHVELSRLCEYAVNQAQDEAANLRVALSSNRQIGAALGHPHAALPDRQRPELHPAALHQPTPQPQAPRHRRHGRAHRRAARTSRAGRATR